MTKSINDNAIITPLHYMRFGCADLQGWMRRFVLVLLGLCVTLAMPPLYLLPLLFVSIPCLLWIIDASPNYRAVFGAGWWFGLGYYVSMIYWFAFALLVEADKFGWLIPFALFGIGGILAIYTGILAYVYSRYLGDKSLWIRCLGFAVLWGGTEWLRASLFSGFPWNLLGYVWTVSDITIQGGYFVSIYVLSFATILVALIPALWAAGRFVVERKIVYGVIAAFALFVGVCGWRIYNAPPLSDVMVGDEGTQTFRLVQGNIKQSMKWTLNGRMQAIKRYLDLSRSTGFEKVNHIIWPETAMGFPFDSGDEWAYELAKVVPKNGYLLTGVIRFKKQLSDKLPIKQRKMQLFNSLQVLNSSAQIVATYDKRHLVPFGEYIPLRWLMPFEKKITHGMMDFTSGVKKSVVEVKRLPIFQSLICYEAIFPDLADNKSKAKLLVNITNDAWFGNSAAPYQHLQMTRMRAVEQGIPLVRAANTGISTAFDKYGRELGRLPLGSAGVLDITLKFQ